MPERPIGVTNLASGTGVALFRTRERTVGGESVNEQYMLNQRDWLTSWRGCASTFLVTGDSLTNVPIATLWNGVGSGVIVVLRVCALITDISGALTNPRTQALSRLTTAPTGGTLHTPVAFDTAQTQAALVEFRGAASSDGVNTLITATPGSVAWRQNHNKVPTQVGQMQFVHAAGAPLLVGTDPVYVREGEGIAVSWVEGNATQARHSVNMVWDEVSFP